MSPLVEKTLSLPLVAKLLFVASVGSLIFALIMEYGFDFKPCILCLWQRVPYVVVTVLSLGTWLWRPYGWHSVILLSLCAAAFLAGMGLAVFHSGVELHWWVGTSGCAVEPLSGASPDDLREALLRTVAPRCDQIAWTFLGLSMTNYNVAFSLALAFFSAAAAARAVQAVNAPRS